MHRNNFDFLRLIFALSVVVTHAFPLSATNWTDPLGNWTHDQICLSYIGVRGFFIISGYLIFQSLERSRGLVDYFWKRALRLWPALAVVLGLTVVLGQFVYDAAVAGPYWSNPEVWSYFPRNITLYALQPKINGVFSTNPWETTINGSLWTISYEFTCYVALAAFFYLRKRLNVSRILLIVAYVAMFVGNVFFYYQISRHSFFINFGQAIELGIFFVAGSILAAFRYENFRHHGWVILGSLVLIVVGVWSGHFLKGFHFVGLPLLVMSLGVQGTPFLRDVGKRWGDMSYGIYIYGFPVQQALYYFFDFNWWELMLVSIPIVMALGWLSWHLIEKRALLLKKVNPLGWLGVG